MQSMLHLDFAKATHAARLERPYSRPSIKEYFLRKKANSQLFTIELRYPLNTTRTVKVKAASREVAEARALKRNPGALGVKHNA